MSPTHVHRPDPQLPAWSADSWRSRPSRLTLEYDDKDALAAAVEKLRSLPPLVTSWEVEKLRSLLADAEDGRRFLLQGGDCAETLDDCRPETIASKLKILLQMSLVLVQGLKKPVIRVGRLAGQYAKPRSRPDETRSINGSNVTLPSYFGDAVNRATFSPDARRPDPALLVNAYQHAAVTLNFVRALIDGGFADLHHPEYWDLSFLHHAGLSPQLREQYERMTRELGDGIRFMEALGEGRIEELTRVEFYTSHEGLNLLYESAQTRTVPRRDGYYLLTTHLPWIGERSRHIDGPHVEFFRGIRNPVGLKIGPSVTPEELLTLARRLNPNDEPGRLVLISRMGAKHVRSALPPLVRAMKGRRCLWVCDPMHGNTITMTTTPAHPQPVKTRNFDDILAELNAAIDALASENAHLGGVHLELTGEDVTECIGGASGITPERLAERYASPCDPRLNYHQSLEVAFTLAHRLAPRNA